MESISLKDAAELVGKDASTIRKFFQKPQYKVHTRTIKGKIFVDKGVLLELYPPEDRQKAEVGGVGRNVPNDAELPPKQEKALSTTVDAAMQALISQLEVKDNQIADLNARQRESNIIIQSLQDKIRQLPAPAQEPSKVEEGGKGWKVAAIVAVAIAVVCAVAFGVALLNGWRFTQL